jgi:integrase
MTARRSRGDGGLSWDDNRKRWIASLTVGYTPEGKRIVKRGSGRTKTEAQRKLREIIRDYEDGQVTSGKGYTVAQAVKDWLEFGLSGRDADTIAKCTILANTHIIPLTWSHVDLDGEPSTIMVWHSVRATGDTKTRKSRRTLELPQRCADALRLHRESQDKIRTDTSATWQDNDLVFCTLVGTELDAANVRRSFRRVIKAAGLNAADWTPRELRHSFVSIMSDAGVPIERISQLVGHSGTTVTETVYRHQLRPVVQGGAQVMDRLFPGSPRAAKSDQSPNG